MKQPNDTPLETAILASIKHDSADCASAMPTNGVANETVTVGNPDEETLELTASEGRLLRRIALQIKSRSDYIWSNRATIGRLPMLAELTKIKEGAELFYAVLTDATWRELSDPEQRKV